ncbi:uncharacterized protein PGTG_16631 [Puccinia graminis f. sp. tritici CRL 75-36-700-3]|uniref:DUF4219 domain-containing protein n=1 Tax=Puccinia graminis f. sp. tritici (strain CRL 75-36-700-3 / race SCCL) TaxID=418459 RepID=E3L230_PUCGT|nr:uncharacterized protein PGTG_16631 [Puccinia graminis f. sp. tritici CRL 75-36-700-3]EFP90605.1 hypothetical protein PGTG_16631 [Puccinia graminis f. sp. tritici CRL 75-36-700-3]
MSNSRNPPILLNDSNYSTWSFLMVAKLSKLDALDVVLGTVKKPKLEDPEKPTKEALAYEEINRIAYIEIIEHLDNHHLAYVSQILINETSFCGFSVWQILKKKYAGDDFVAKDLALEKFLDLDYHGSTIDFISEVRAANQKLISSKIGLDDQVKNAIILRKLPSEFQSLKTVLSIGCSSDTVAMMLNRLERHAAQNHLNRSSSIPSPQALLTTDDKYYLCPHCKKGFTICSHCDKAGHRESICFEKHPERRPSKSSATSSVSKPAATAQAHLAYTVPHGFTPEQVESERNFQAMLANPEFKKLNINAEHRL